MSARRRVTPVAIGSLDSLRDRYSTVEKLEDDGISSLSRVRDRLRDEEVALRTIIQPTNDYAVSRNLMCRYSKVEHPFLTQILDFGEQAGFLFYAREDTRGLELSETLKAPSEEWILRVILEGLAGLAPLHDAGLTHGVVTPRYLRVVLARNRPGGLRITDAGLRFLRHSATDTAYDSPEVRRGAEPMPGNDIYQLATTVLGIVGGANALDALGQGQEKPFRAHGRGLDRHLLELLDGFVLPNPAKRPRQASEALRMIKAVDWRRPAEAPSLEDILSPEFVGNERSFGQLRHFLHEAKESGMHGAEVLGEEGAGRTRILEEISLEAISSGWCVIWVESRCKSVDQLLKDVQEAVHTSLELEDVNSHSSANEEVLPGIVASQLCAAVRESGQSLLLIADDADRLSADLQRLLRIVVSEAGPRAIGVIASGSRPVGLPGAKQVSLERLKERDVRRLLAPLIAEGVNPDLAISRVYAVSGGNPLWIRLILASWIQSGQLRLTRGRLSFDDRVATPIPDSVHEAVARIVEGLTPGERTAVQGLAVWGRAMPAAMAEKLFQGHPIPEQLAESNETGVRLIGESLQEVILESLSTAKRRDWHKRILELLESAEVDSRTYATHLLGAGRTSEGVQALLQSARVAEEHGDLRAAWLDLKSVLEQVSAGVADGELEREELALRAARIALRIGELSWARGALDELSPSSGRGPKARRYEFELLLLRANVSRDLNYFKEAAKLYDEARASAAAAPDLRNRIPEVSIEQAGNDLNQTNYAVGIQRLESVMPELEASTDLQLYANALHRLATLEGKSGEPRRAALYEQRAVRLAMRLDSPLLVARGSIALALWYLKLGKSERALRMLDRGERFLEHCPHDGLRAAILERRAQIFLDRGQNKAAERSLLEAELLTRRMGDHKQLPVVLVELGRLFRRQGRLSQAAERYREAIAVAEEFDSYIIHVARANLAELLTFEGQYEAAEPQFHLALQDADDNVRGLILLLLGRLNGRQGKYENALMYLERGDDLLRKHNPRMLCIAQLEIAEVLLAAGDPGAAQFRLSQVANDVPAEGEHRATYELLLGRSMAAMGQSPFECFDRAIYHAERLDAPTFTAYVLSEALEVVASAAGDSGQWIRENLERLSTNASRTDSRAIDVRSRLIQALFANKQQGSGTHIAGAVQKWLQGAGADERDPSLGDSVRNLEEAAGAMVLVIGVDAAGKPVVSSIPRVAQPQEAGVRPYRIASREFNRKTFREALAAVDGNAIEAARLLRLPYSTFRYQSEKLGLLKPVRRGPRRKK